MKKDSSTNVVEKLIQQKGVFQKRLAFALTLLALPNGAQLVIGIFLTYMPNEYSCRLPPDYNTTTMDHNSTEELYVGKCSLDWSASREFVCLVCNESRARALCVFADKLGGILCETAGAPRLVL